jgi:hypothetical protein
MRDLVLGAKQPVPDFAALNPGYVSSSTTFVTASLQGRQRKLRSSGWPPSRGTMCISRIGC